MCEVTTGAGGGRLWTGPVALCFLTVPGPGPRREGPATGCGRGREGCGACFRGGYICARIVGRGGPDQERYASAPRT